MSTAGEQTRGGPAFGIFLILIGAAALIFARRIGETGFSDYDDPGAAALPVALGILLLVGGVVEVASSLWVGRFAQPVGAAPNSSGQFVEPTANLAGLAMVLVTVAALIAYLVLLPWLGFSLCSLVLCALLMKLLGARAWLVALMSLVLVVGVKLLFSRMFKVQLPEGLLEEWLLRIGL